MKTDNELIAEFIGWKRVSSNSEIYILPNGENIVGLNFHKSWDWLMPVVEKIEGLYYYGHLTKNTHDGRHYMSFITKDCDTVAYSSPGQTKIESVYKAVVIFIEWHNSQP